MIIRHCSITEPQFDLPDGSGTKDSKCFGHCQTTYGAHTVDRRMTFNLKHCYPMQTWSWFLSLVGVGARFESVQIPLIFLCINADSALHDHWRSSFRKWIPSGSKRSTLLNKLRVPANRSAYALSRLHLFMINLELMAVLNLNFFEKFSWEENLSSGKKLL